MKRLQPRTLIFWLITLVIAGAALYYACNGIDWHRLLASIRHVNPYLLFASCAIASFSFFVRGIRWRVLLSAERPIPVSTVFYANMVGYLGNFYLIARAGEVLRSALLGQRARISASFIFATAMTERVFDAVALVVISLLALPLAPRLPGVFLSTARLLGLCALGCIAIAFIVCYYRSVVVNWLGRLPFAAGIRLRLATIADQFLLGARSIHHPRRALIFTGLTLVIWTLDATSSIVTAQALHISLSFPQAFILLAALGLASALPSTPGAVGIFQFVAVTIMVPFGLSKNDALAYILVSQAFSYVVVTFWGVIGLWEMRQKNPAAGLDIEIPIQVES